MSLYGLGVAVCNTDWIIQPSTRVSLAMVKTWIQITPLTSWMSLGMMVTVEPLASVIST